MKKILTTAVFAMALAMVANAYNKTVSTFEAEGESELNYYFSTAVTPSEGPNYSSYAGLLPSETNSTKYLEISTDTALERQANGGVPVDVVGNFYIDMMAKFNETESAVVGNEDKLALYMNVNSNLVVVAGADTNFCETTTRLVPGTWYRVAIHMIQNIYSSGDARPGFVVSINGVDVAAKADSYMGLTGLTPTALESYNENQLFPSILTGAQITSLAISGVGGVDDIVFADTKNTDSSVTKPEEWYDVAVKDVTYKIVDASGDEVSGVSVKSVDWTDLDTGIYSVQANADGKPPVIVGDSIGVNKLEQQAAGKDVLISIPWKSLDGKNIRVADMFTNPVDGDVANIYHNGKFVPYTYSEEDAAWSTDVEGYTAETTFGPGTAVMYRPFTTHDVVLVGIADTSATVPALETGTAQSPVWSAVGSTVASDTPISTVFSGMQASAKAEGDTLDQAKDMIAVQTPNGKYKRYFYGTDGKWKKMTGLGNVEDVDEGDVIKPGRAFMYRSTTTAPTVNFGE